MWSHLKKSTSCEARLGSRPSMFVGKLYKNILKVSTSFFPQLKGWWFDPLATDTFPRYTEHTEENAASRPTELLVPQEQQSLLTCLLAERFLSTGKQWKEHFSTCPWLCVESLEKLGTHRHPWLTCMELDPVVHLSYAQGRTGEGGCSYSLSLKDQTVLFLLLKFLTGMVCWGQNFNLYFYKVSYNGLCSLSQIKEGW